MSILLALTCACLLAGFVLMGLMFHRRDAFIGLVGLTVVIVAGVLGTVHGALTS
jgi:hypothetical protein